MKKVVQDIQIKKTIKQNIPISIVDNNIDYISRKNTIKSEGRIHIPRTPEMRRSGSYLNIYIKMIFILSLILGISYFSYIYFQKATVIVENKVQDINFINEAFLGYKDSGKTPSFEVMILEDTMNKNVSFASQKNVSQKAKGTVIFKNEYNAKPQKLSVNTKITEDTGMVYLTDHVITIPGYTKDKTGKIIPGTVKATVTAAVAGNTYNTDAKAFLISGFQKTDKYAKIYAIADGGISGGADGNMYSLDSVNLGVLEATANTVFKEQMTRKMAAQVDQLPEKYILYKNTIDFKYTYDQNTQSKEKEGVVVLKGTMSAVIFKTSELEQSIIHRVLPNLKNTEYTEIEIPDLSVFGFNFTEKNQIIEKGMTNVSFSLTGKSPMVWNPNLEILKNSLLGAKSTDVENIAKNDPGITSISVKFRFPWQDYMPSELNKIDILNN